MSDRSEREAGRSFMPKFDDKGLLSAVVVHHETRDVLMVAFMDAEALNATRETGVAHFHSRSRGKLWKKGESSGNILEVHEILVDCDQDALIIYVDQHGSGACHTGRNSCFYREVAVGEDASPTALKFTEDLTFDPDSVYKK